MTPANARAMYRDMIAEWGEDVVLRRVGAAGSVAEVTVRARVGGFRPEEMVGDFKLGDLRVIFLAEGVAGFPLPIRSGGTDRIVRGGTPFVIQSVDNVTRNVSGDLIAYELRVRGAG